MSGPKNVSAWNAQAGTGTDRGSVWPGKIVVVEPAKKICASRFWSFGLPLGMMYEATPI
jgi:hypothetical protein